jgi:hypothetical protein
MNKEKEKMQTVNFECVMAKPVLRQSWSRIRIETNMVPLEGMYGTVPET